MLYLPLVRRCTSLLANTIVVDLRRAEMNLKYLWRRGFPAQRREVPCRVGPIYDSPTLGLAGRGPRTAWWERRSASQGWSNLARGSGRSVVVTLVRS